LILLDFSINMINNETGILVIGEAAVNSRKPGSDCDDLLSSASLLKANSEVHGSHRMLGKFVLWLSAVMFTAYGLACLFSPGLPMGYAGLEAVSGDAVPEIAAMYGGLQTGFGLFCLLGALQAAFYRPALVLLLLGIGGIALARCFWAFSAPGDISAYTYGAMAYEYLTAILAAIALRR
jgi:hypothetical protein